jgi:predicted Zn-dependent protease
MSKAGYDPQGAVVLQETFVRLSEGRETDWLSGMFSSHPPSQERVDTNKRTAATLPSGGETGKDSYQAALKKTHEVKPAYDAYDEGREAIADKKLDLAAEKAEDAIALFPDEANFYALRGDVRYMNEKYDTAIDNYDIAIRRRDNFFQYYLQRGLANEKLGNDLPAVSDLEKSNELFPTAIAHNSLGNIAAKQGRKNEAIEHYSMVASGEGPVAESALESLVRLDLADNPGKYLRVRCFQDNTGNLGVSVGNATPVAVKGVRFVVQYQDSQGTQRRERSISAQIASGQSVDASTGIGPYTSGSSCPVEISAAQIVE